jgi:hypothetical protein
MPHLGFLVSLWIIGVGILAILWPFIEKIFLTIYLVLRTFVSYILACLFTPFIVVWKRLTVLWKNPFLFRGRGTPKTKEKKKDKQYQMAESEEQIKDRRFMQKLRKQKNEDRLQKLARKQYQDPEEVFSKGNTTSDSEETPVTDVPGGLRTVSRKKTPAYRQV